ncbi:MAG: PAS domain S-box protein [Oscillatoria sp. PMC 1068.18]|nr:PAS domain S-box protein [Oscillatoria sp. PMC 1076.18]MEC4990419.1 PAS domain S-box protein [Oscillatoria sp. PMC 1068.18]
MNSRQRRRENCLETKNHQGELACKPLQAFELAHQARLVWDNLIAGVALRIRESLDFNEILQTTANEVQQILGCDRVCLHEFEPDWSGRVVVESVSAFKWSLANQVVGDAFLPQNWVKKYQEGEYLAIADIATAKLDPSYATFLTKFKVRATLVIPILHDSQLWGLLIADNCHAPRQWEKEEILGLQQIAVHVGIAINQASLIEQLEAAKAELASQVKLRTAQLEDTNIQLLEEVRERHQITSEVAKREVFLGQVLDRLLTFVGVLTPEGILREVNQAFLAIAGLTREDVINQPFAETYWWAYSSQAAQKIRDAIAQTQQGKAVRFDLPVQIESGAAIVIDFSLTPLPDNTGKISYLIFSGIDISDAYQQARQRQQVESELRQSKDQIYQFAAIVESSQDAIVSKNLDGIIASWNQAAEQLFGYSASEMLGTHVSVLIPPEERAEAEKILQAVYQGEIANTYETKRLRKDGSLVDVALTISPIYNENQQVIGASKIARDISERKRAEKVFREQADILRIFYDSSPLMMGVVEISDNDILHVSQNLATGEFFGITPEQLTGKWASELGVPAKQLQLWLTHYRRSQEQQQPVQFDYEHLTETKSFSLLVTVAFLGISASQRPKFSFIVQDISERKLAEANQLETEKVSQELQLLENILDIILAGYWDWDIPANKEYLSPGFKRMFGYEDNELPNHPDTWQNLIFAEDLPKVLNSFERHVRSHGKEPYYNEVRYRHKNGDTVWVICSGQVIEWDLEGNPLRMIGCHIDISDRKQAELNLQAKTQELDRFFSVTLDLLCIADIDGHFRRLNHQWEKSLGYPLRELENSQLVDYLHPDDLQPTLNAIAQLRQQQTVFSFINRYRRCDGSYIWLEWRAVPVDNLIYAAARDISKQQAALRERKQSELQLKEAKDQLELVLQASSEGFWDWNLTTNEIYFSPRWKEMFGYQDEELENSLEMWGALIFEEDRLQALKLIEAYNSGKIDSFNITQRFRHKNGSTVYILSRAIHLRDERGNVTRMIGSHLDITQMVEIQEALKTSEMQLSSVLNSSLDGIMAFKSVRDERGKIIDFEWLLVNPTACEIVGRKAEDLLGKRMLTELPGNKAEGLFDAYVAVVESGETSKREFYYNHDGIDCWFENIAVKLGDGFAVTFRNITAIKKSEKELQYVNQELENSIDDLKQRNNEMLLLNEISDFLQACLSVEEASAAIVTLIEPLFPQCSGCIFITSASRNRLQKLASWGKHLHSETEFYPHDCWGLRRGRIHLVGENRLGLRCNHIHKKDSLAVTLCIPMIAQGETLGLFYLSAETANALPQTKQQLAQTVAEQIALAITNLYLRETLQYQSIRDPLTGLYNRRYLEESLNQEIERAQRHQHEIGLIMIDVDHFKKFNDTYGHDAGDQVLQAVGKVLKKSIRSSDIACRYGGEEMTLVLPESSLEVAANRAEAIRQAIAELAVNHNGKLLDSVTASLGVACFPQHGITGTAIVQAADAALYRAKAAGRNQIIIAP